MLPTDSVAQLKPALANSRGPPRPLKSPVTTTGPGITGSTTWIETQKERDRLLPPYKQWQRRVGRCVRKVI